MMWVLLIVLSARNGFGGNIEGGVAVQSVEFQTENACKAAAHDFLEVNGNRGFFVSATCVRKGGN